MVIVYFYGNGIYYCHKRQSAIYLMLLKDQSVNMIYF